MIFNQKIKALLLGVILLTFSCKTDTPKEPIQPPVFTIVKAPDFNADSAYYFIEKQVNFGPRVPNTPQHDAAAAWLIEKTTEFADTVYIQKADLKAFDGTMLKSTNIIGSFNDNAQKRILLAAHWDTRPFADQDSERTNEPILGANDGASGVGVLLEIARILSEKNVSIGVDIIFFDSEDYGQPSFSNLPYVADSYCLGSQYWAANPHKKNYSADFGILLDMVGAENAIFTHEGTSVYYAKNYLNRVWNIAKAIGFSNYFSFQETPPITDDHLYVNKILGIPTIDIIQYEKTSRSGFGHYWHTHKDDMSIIDKNTLKAVGQTVTQVVYQFDSGNF
jgi:Zn-dependent M28 family amino/carboxypeptidase